MTLADDLANAPDAAPQPGAKPCLFGRALAAFPDDAPALLEMARPGHDVIRRKQHLMNVLRKHGHPMGHSTIDRHLAGACGCFG